MHSKTTNIYLPEMSPNYANWITPIFKDNRGGVDVRRVPESKCQNILLLTGGEDICPEYYGETDETFCQLLNPQRDLKEWAALKFAVQHNIPTIGICRGAQLVAVFNQHSLVQHVAGHNVRHKITFMDGEVHTMTSQHHQMMRLFPYANTRSVYKNYMMLAWSTKNESSLYNVGEITSAGSSHIRLLDGGREPEIVYFPATRQLAIQGHPERMQMGSALIKKLQLIVKDMMQTDNFGVWC